jgi:hypothetical protein
METLLFSFTHTHTHTRHQQARASAAVRLHANATSSCVWMLHFNITLDGPNTAPLRCRLELVDNVSAEEEEEEAPVEAPSFLPGAEVLLCGLVQRPELNGVRGQVKGVNPNGRLCVHAAGRTLSLASINLAAPEPCIVDTCRLIFFHISGRLKCVECPAGAVSVVLAEAADLVDRQVGGARHHLVRCSTDEPLRAESAGVAPGEQLLVVLHGKCFHLSPLCEGNISSQLPLPSSTSSWMDVATTDEPLSAYVDKVLPGGEAPPIPIEVYARAFRLRHGGDAGGGAVAADTSEDAKNASARIYASHLSSVSGGGAKAIERADRREPASRPVKDRSKPLTAARGTHRPVRSSAEIAAAAAAGTYLDFTDNESASPAGRCQQADGSGCGGGGSNGAADDGDRAGGGMCGFTEDEVMLLLTNDAKPWDDDAADVLERIRRKQRQPARAAGRTNVTKPKGGGMLV